MPAGSTFLLVGGTVLPGGGANGSRSGEKWSGRRQSPEQGRITARVRYRLQGGTQRLCVLSCRFVPPSLPGNDPGDRGWALAIERLLYESFPATFPRLRGAHCRRASACPGFVGSRGAGEDRILSGVNHFVSCRPCLFRSRALVLVERRSKFCSSRPPVRFGV